MHYTYLNQMKTEEKFDEMSAVKTWKYYQYKYVEERKAYKIHKNNSYRSQSAS